MLASTLSSLFLLFSYVNVPVAEMREKPSDSAEVVSSAYFAEPIAVLEQAGDWAKIQTTVDKYQGWVRQSAVVQRQDEYPKGPNAVVAYVTRCAAHLYHVEDTIYGPILTLPFESRLEVIAPKEESAERWLKVALPDGKEAYIQRGDISLHPKVLTVDEVCALSRQFLGLPYTWGGRSSFGYDCSGFIQMLYRQMGIMLPRDSKDQVDCALLQPITFAALKAGDLLYWGYSAEKIRHVGMYVGDDTFIHISVRENKPYLRYSKMSDPEWNGSPGATYPFRAARTLKLR